MAPTKTDWAARKARPCTECGKPVNRTGKDVKYCFECVSGGIREQTSGERKITRLLEALLPGRSEQLEEALHQGAKLRLFYCKCGKLYIGVNHLRCDVCVKQDEDDVRNDMPGRAPPRPRGNWGHR